MGLNDTPSGERIHIAFFGKRNVGKSSLVNAVTGQELAVVSDVKGTTTDPVLKSMELLPLGPVMIIDTPGYDDEGQLGELRIKKTKQILNKTDIAVLVTDGSRDLDESEKELESLFNEKGIQYIIVYNKSDLLDAMDDSSKMYVSSKTGKGIFELKEKLGSLAPKDSGRRLVGDLIACGDTVVLVTPIDSAAPKGRMILPQQQMLRDVLDEGAVAIVTRETELEVALKNTSVKPKLVITDSQAFEKVSAIVPDDIYLTSFSILMARYKGFLDTSVDGVEALNKLSDGDSILISEGCTHHRQCDDIGTVKLPKWIKKYTGKDFKFVFSSGTGFPEDLSEYKLIIHCGGCMLNERELLYRMKCAVDQKVPFTNYGILIAQMNGILERSIKPIKELQQ